ncbi:hypothetical protein LJB85_01810 [Porphyromonadaceae bacterium OttesenSCG-928-L07]|nr:hypothetical protein [Porphyromonadaceae bacterium OttesenSCG-928-L07]MDL2251538.1 hypothetical protein [Odoribacter sp. OttesenSCG-928-J03]
MKKLLFAIMIVLCFTGAQAQKKSWNFLKGEKALNVLLDYSEAQMDYRDAESFFELKNAKDPDYQEKYESETLVKFVRSVNKSLTSGIAVVFDSKNANYLLTIKVVSVDRNGNINATILISKMDTAETLAQFSAKVEGGHFGSFANLSKDGMNNLGTYVGKYISKKMK